MSLIFFDSLIKKINPKTNIEKDKILIVKKLNKLFIIINKVHKLKKKFL